MSSFGWRIPFIVGGVFGLTALFIRRRLSETDTFLTEQQEAAPPVRASAWREFLAHRRQAAQVIGLTAGLTVVYYSWVIAAPLTPSRASAPTLPVPWLRACWPASRS